MPAQIHLANATILAERRAEDDRRARQIPNEGRPPILSALTRVRFGRVIGVVRYRGRARRVPQTA